MQMCGIIGIKGEKSFDLMQQNLRRLQHRGPDSQGIVDLGYQLIFGATRLALTDPHERSNQPMVDTESGNAIIFNGEVYNFKIIRQNLKNNGIRFETESDTEVILKAITFLGPDVISSFEGMFAFGFYEKCTNNLIIARDYLGKKPLYYYLGENKFIFSSSSKLIHHITNELKLNYKSLNTFLKLGFTIDPNSMHEGIVSVIPGQIITIDLNNLKIQNSNTYLPKIFIDPNTTSLAEEIESALIDRVSGHNKFAISLSGGVDSSLLAILSSKLGLNATAYTLNFPHTDKERYNEDAHNAKKIATSLGLEIQTVDFPRAEMIPSILDEYVMAMDEPNSNPTGLSMMSLYSKISEDGHRVVLTGDGSDEVFGGYERYEITNRFRNFPQLNLRLLKHNAINKNLHFLYSAKAEIIFGRADSLESWQFWHQIADMNWIKELFPNILNFEFSILGDELSKTLNERSKVARLMFRDLRTWLSMESNQKLDRVSMWYSTEARSPFQSERVVAVGYKKMKKYNFRKVHKELLFEAYPQLNSLSLNKSKLGFISPLGHWLRLNPEMVNSSLQSLNKNFDLSMNELDKLRNAPQQGNYVKFKMLWTLIVLERWLTLNNH